MEGTFNYLGIYSLDIPEKSRDQFEYFFGHIILLRYNIGYQMFHRVNVQTQRTEDFMMFNLEYEESSPKAPSISETVVLISVICIGSLVVWKMFKVRTVREYRECSLYYQIYKKVEQAEPDFENKDERTKVAIFNQIR